MQLLALPREPNNERWVEICGARVESDPVGDIGRQVSDVHSALTILASEIGAEDTRRPATIARGLLAAIGPIDDRALQPLDLVRVEADFASTTLPVRNHDSWALLYGLSLTHALVAELLRQGVGSLEDELRHVYFHLCRARFDAAREVHDLLAKQPAFATALVGVDVYLITSLREWIAVVTSTERPQRYFVRRCGLDPEQEVVRVLYERPDGPPLLRRLATSSERQAHVSEEIEFALLNVVRDWFLRRYDLVGTQRLLDGIQLSNRKVGSLRRWWLTRIPVAWRVRGLWSIMLGLFVVGLALPQSPYALLIAVCWPLLHMLWVGARAVHVGLPLSYPHLPRVTAGVAVGALFVLSLPSEITYAFLRLPPTQVAAVLQVPLWLTIVLGTAAAFVFALYLYVQLASQLQMTGRMPRSSRSSNRHLGHGLLVARVGTVLLIATVQALVLVTVQAALVGRVFGIGESADLPCLCMPRLWRFEGFRLPVSPEYVLLGAGMALFAGLIIQMLWEEKTATAPPV